MWHGAQCYILQDKCPTRGKKKGFHPLSIREVENICLGFIHLFQFSWNLGQLFDSFQCHWAIFIHSYLLPLLGGRVTKVPTSSDFHSLCNFHECHYTFRIFIHFHIFPTYLQIEFGQISSFSSVVQLAKLEQRNKFLHYWTELSNK
jgi:hypothetical protein